MIISLDLSRKVDTNWCITPLLTKVNLVIFQEPFLIHEVSSWFQGWCPKVMLIIEVHTNWYITLLCRSKIYNSRYSHPSGTIPDVGGCSWLLHAPAPSYFLWLYKDPSRLKEVQICHSWIVSCLKCSKGWHFSIKAILSMSYLLS